MSSVKPLIIENFRELRERLAKNGAKFGSETDTEVVAHLVTDEMKQGKPPAEAVAAALKQLRGAFALAFLFAGEDDLMIGARKGSPLDRKSVGGTSQSMEALGTRRCGCRERLRAR